MNRLYSGFSEMARQYPDKVAIYFGEKSLTYSELNILVSKIASRIINGRREASPIVGIYLNRSINMVASILAVLKVGGTVVPISPCVPRNRAKYLFSTSCVDVVISESLHQLQLQKILDRQNSIFTMFCDLLEEGSNKYVFDNQVNGCNECAYILFTSGTTGQPKGVMVRESSIYNVFTFLSKKVELGQDDSFFALTDFTFDVSIIEIIYPFTIGANIVLAAQGVISVGDRIKSYLDKYDISVVHATPATWDILFQIGWVSKGRKKKFFSSGESLSVDLARKILHRKEDCLWNMYAPTESTIWSTYYKVTLKELGLSVPIGRGFDNVNYYILNECRDAVKDGEVGHLFLSGACLSAGYIGDQKLTCEKFLRNKENQCLMYDTGDLVRLNYQSQLEYVGRSDNQIKVGGVRIDPTEIEFNLNKLDFIRNTAVIDCKIFSYTKKLVAFVELDSRKIYQKYFNEFTERSVQVWASVYNATYGEDKEADKDLSGWRCSITGKKYKKNDFFYWFTCLSELIGDASVSKFLDIGGGTGYALDFFKNKIKKYTAVESSEVALSVLRDKINENPNIVGEIYNSYAHDFVLSDTYDCILLNSVVQYFPSTIYFEHVLAKCIENINKKGIIIIGDIRNPELIELYMSEVNSEFKPSNGMQTDELFLSPKYIKYLRKIFPEISHIDYSLKHSDNNDVGYYRYNCVIYFDKKPTFVEPLLLKQGPTFNLNDFMKVLDKNKDKPVILKKVYSARFADTNNFSYPSKEEITSLNTPISNKKLQFKHKDLQKINDSLCSHYMHIRYDEQRPGLVLELHFYPKKGKLFIRSKMDPAQVTEDFSPEMSVEPIFPWIKDKANELIFSELNENLPNQLVPKEIKYIFTWPKTLSGKIDRSYLKKIAQLEKKNKAIGDSFSEEFFSKSKELFGVGDGEIDFSGASSLLVHYFIFWISERFHVTINYESLLKIDKTSDLLSLLFSKENIKEKGVALVDV